MGGSSGTSGSFGSYGSVPAVTFAGAGTGFLSALPGAAAVSAAGGTSPIVVALHHGRVQLGPSLPGYTLAASQGRGLVPIALVVGLSAVVIGALLMGSGFLKRRKLRKATPPAVAA